MFFLEELMKDKSTKNEYFDRVGVLVFHLTPMSVSQSPLVFSKCRRQCGEYPSRLIVDKLACDFKCF